MIGKSPSLPDAEIAAAARTLATGGVVCIPTETFYGLAVDISSAAGLAALVRLKGRRPDAPFALIAADTPQARAIASIWPDAATKLANAYWPGPLTLVLPAAAHVAPELIGPGGGVGVRVSSHPIATALAQALGRPITATSANPGGLPPAADVASARGYFGDTLAMYLDGGPAAGDTPSTVAAVDTNGQLTILRQGAVTVEIQAR